MICQECRRQGLTSTVRGGMSTMTLMGHSPFWDEEGKYHSHDPNRIGTSYSCSNGHSWSESKLSSCPSCDYGKEDS